METSANPTIITDSNIDCPPWGRQLGAPPLGPTAATQKDRPLESTAGRWWGSTRGMAIQDRPE